MGINAPPPKHSPRSYRPETDRLTMAEALFSTTQRAVLGLLFGNPQRSYFATEIIALAGGGSGGVQRELKRLLASSLVRVTWIGNQKHYQANPTAPIYEELCSLLRKTTGLADPLRAALSTRLADIELALVFGSVARNSDTAASDIDLLLVSDHLGLEALFGLLAPAERTLDRKIHPTLYTRDEFRRRRASRSAFLSRVLAGDVMVLIGELPHDLAGSG